MGKRPDWSKKKQNYNLPAGKGDHPRSIFSEKFRDNYDSIDWGHKDSEDESVEDGPKET